VEGVDRPDDEALKAMIPGACHNPHLVIALEQMIISPAWAAYTYRQAKDAILKMARRSPQMLEGAKILGGKDSTVKKVSTDGGKLVGNTARGNAAGGRGSAPGRGGDFKYGPGGAGRGGPGRGGTGGRFGGNFQGGRLSGGVVPPGLKCFNCGGNHFQRDCPILKRSDAVATGQAAMGEEAPIKCTYCNRMHVGGVRGCWKKAWDMQQTGGNRNSQGKRAIHYEEQQPEEEEDDERPARRGARRA